MTRRMLENESKHFYGGGCKAKRLNRANPSSLKKCIKTRIVFSLKSKDQTLWRLWSAICIVNSIN